MIEVKNIRKVYKNKGQEVVILDDISLTIGEHDRVAIIGENGCGKTTLVSIISGFREKTSGEVIFDKSIMDPQKDIGIQFQKETYPKGITVKDALDFYKLLYKLEEDESFERLIKAFGLSKLMGVDANSLSGGQQQRLNSLLSLICDPKLVIIDELSNNLDIRIKEKVLKEVRDFIVKKDKALLLVSHNYEEIRSLANRVIAIDKGKIIYDERLKANTSIESIKKIFSQILPFEEE